MVPSSRACVLVFIGLKVFIYSFMHLLNSATVLMVSLLLYGQSPLRGSYILHYVHVLALVTGSRTVTFVFVMA